MSVNSMLHASSWLGYSWDLGDLVYHGIKESTKEVTPGRRSEQSRCSRREKFRTSSGPSREELHWIEILTILCKVSLLHESFGYCDAEVDHMPKLSASAELRTRFNGEDGVQLEYGQGSEIKRMLQEVLWPFDIVHDIASMFSIHIEWDNIPPSADPVLGGGYKAASLSNKSRQRFHKVQDTDSNDEKDSDDHCGQGASLGRGERKRWQVEKIASALKSFQLNPGAKIVDFGCGSGALTLPLAAIFPEQKFVGVDFKLQSIILLEERARKANLRNVSGVYGRIENYLEPFDACVALHACGIATDLALLQALKNRAAYVVSPCCVGKLQIPIQWSLKSTDSGRSFRNLRSVIARGNPLNPGEEELPESSLPSTWPTDIESKHAPEAVLLSPTSTSAVSSCPGSDFPSHLGLLGENSDEPSIKYRSLSHELSTEVFTCRSCADSVENLVGCVSVSSKLAYPRSRWLAHCVSETEFQVLARAADWSSYDHESLASRLHLLCKVVLELDRNEASRELGYLTGLYNLSNEKAGTVGVSHVLVGKPPQLSPSPVT